MSHEHQSGWREFVGSRTGIALMTFLGVILLLTLWEHRIHVFTGEAGLLLLLLLCPLMHLFMHGGHGGGSGDGGRHDH